MNKQLLPCNRHLHAKYPAHSPNPTWVLRMFTSEEVNAAASKGVCSLGHGQSYLTLGYIIHVSKKAKEKAPWPWLDPKPKSRAKGLKFHQFLCLSQSQTTESLPSLSMKSHQSLSLPQNQSTKIHQFQATLISSAPIYKPCILFSLRQTPSKVHPSGLFPSNISRLRFAVWCDTFTTGSRVVILPAIWAELQ